MVTAAVVAGAGVLKLLRETLGPYRLGAKVHRQPPADGAQRTSDSRAGTLGALTCSAVPAKSRRIRNDHVEPLTYATLNCAESDADLPANPVRSSKYQGFIVLDLPLDTTSIGYCHSAIKAVGNRRSATSPSRLRRPPLRTVFPNLSREGHLRRKSSLAYLGRGFCTRERSRDGHPADLVVVGGEAG